MQEEREGEQRRDPGGGHHRPESPGVADHVRRAILVIELHTFLDVCAAEVEMLRGRDVDRSSVDG